MPRSHFRAFAAASVAAVAAMMLCGCTQTPTTPAAEDCSGLIAKVLLTDDSATTVAKFTATDVPTIFAIPASPAPTCYYSSIVPPASQGGTSYVDTHRTLLYIGLSDSDAQALIASIRKTVSAKPWTVRYDYGTPVPTPTPAPTATPIPVPTTTSARWYYNFTGGPTEDKGEMGYFLNMPVSPGRAIQAGLGKPVNVLRIETDLRQLKK